MRIYFATNDHFYSKLFNYIFEEPVSHIALGFFTNKLDLVIDCTKPTGKLRHFNYWSYSYNTVYYADINYSEEEELKAFYSALDCALMVPYDWGAYWYGFFLGIRKKLIGTPLPNINKFNNKSLKHCCEIMTSQEDLLLPHGVDIKGVDFSAMTPHMIGEMLYNKSTGNKLISWPKGVPNAYS